MKVVTGESPAGLLLFVTSIIIYKLHEFIHIVHSLSYRNISPGYFISQLVIVGEFGDAGSTRPETEFQRVLARSSRDA